MTHVLLSLKWRNDKILSKQFQAIVVKKILEFQQQDLQTTGV
jgi:hypothetical protein